VNFDGWVQIGVKPGRPKTVDQKKGGHVGKIIPHRESGGGGGGGGGLSISKKSLSKQHILCEEALEDTENTPHIGVKDVKEPKAKRKPLQRIPYNKARSNRKPGQRRIQMAGNGGIKPSYGEM